MESQGPDPVQVPIPPSLKPHPFMALNKFDTCKLHEMTAGTSSLRAHPSWDNGNPTTCPRCNESPETWVHAILSCPARESPRNRHLQAARVLGPDTSAWLLAAILGARSRFIRSTRTAFPRSMFSRPTSAASLVSSRTSSVVSLGYFMSSQEI